MKSSLQLLPAVLAIFCLLSPLPGASGQSPAAAAPWYKLDDNATLVVEMTLKPGEAKKGEVKTKKPVVLGFTTDVFALKELTKEQQKAYVDQNIIELDAGGAVGKMFSTYGGSSTFEPKGGKISFTVRNKSDLTVKVAVYTEPVTEKAN